MTTEYKQLFVFYLNFDFESSYKFANLWIEKYSIYIFFGYNFLYKPFYSQVHHTLERSYQKYEK